MNQLIPHFFPLVRHLHCCTDQAMTEVMESRGLTAAQCHIMGFITHAATPPCPRDIEEAFRLSHPTVSGLLGRLEKKGFLEFQPDESDRRCKRIYLLPKAIELDEAIQKAITSNEQRLLEGFSAQEEAQFREFLTRAIHNMGGDKIHKEEIE